MNEKMIKEGYAWEYTYNKAYKYQSAFKSDQDMAKNSKV
jgi:endonuclease YncB( thermonuclease family)